MLIVLGFRCFLPSGLGFEKRGSWAMLSFNLLLFGTDVDQILSARYVAELDPRSSTTKTEMARSYVMNFALRSFEFPDLRVTRVLVGQGGNMLFVWCTRAIYWVDPMGVPAVFNMVSRSLFVSMSVVCDVLHIDWSLISLLKSF